MKTDKIAKNKNSKDEGIPPKIKKAPDNKTPSMPQEFEEDRSMDIRMKPQSLKGSGVKNISKKKK